jgi:hypothetical protein
LKAPAVHEAKPGFYDGLLGRFALKPKDRWIALILVRLVRFPAVIGLLAAWHRARSRRK